jgi:hypothetical protein
LLGGPSLAHESLLDILYPGLSHALDQFSGSSPHRMEHGEYPEDLTAIANVHALTFRRGRCVEDVGYTRRDNDSFELWYRVGGGRHGYFDSRRREWEQRGSD